MGRLVESWITSVWKVIVLFLRLAGVSNDRIQSIAIKLYRLYSFFRKRLFFELVQRVLARRNISLSQAARKSQVKQAISLLAPRPSPFRLVRLGGEADGGYLVPDDFQELTACFSPGVAESANFELALADRGVRSFMVDYSIDSSPVSNDLFDFEKLFLATWNEPNKFVRLDDWIASKGQAHGDLILQMDIEGSEWPILADVSAETLSRFRIIVLEMHELDNLLTNQLGIEIFGSVLRKLNEQFSVVHLHPNNCCGALNYQGIQIPRVLEVTLIRNDRYRKSKQVFDPTIPHPLDVPNVPGKKALALSKDWVG